MSNPFDSLTSSGDSWRRPSLSASNNAAYLSAVDSALNIEKSKDIPARRKSHNIDMYFHDIQPGYASGTENKELRSQVMQLQAQIDSLTRELQTSATVKKTLENEISSLRGKMIEYNDMSAMMGESQYRINQLEAKLNDLQRENTSLRSSTSSSSSKSNTPLDEAQKTIKLLQARLGTKDQMLHKLTIQHEQLCID